MTKPIAPPAKAPSLSDFYTLKKSNEGVRMKLRGPDGKETEAWIDVRGQDSELFQRAQNASRRALLAYIETHGDAKEIQESPEYDAFGELQKRKLRAALVVGWSFPEEANEANILEFFKNAPDIATQVDVFASKRERFVGA